MTIFVLLILFLLEISICFLNGTRYRVQKVKMYIKISDFGNYL